MKVLTRAKVNLHLDVLKRRPDGYHEIETILQSVGLHDELEIELNESGRVSIDIECDPGVRSVCDPGEIPNDHHNLCARAIDAMRPHAGRNLGARIGLLKRIPWGAGSRWRQRQRRRGDSGGQHRARFLGLSTDALEAAALGGGKRRSLHAPRGHDAGPGKGRDPHSHGPGDGRLVSHRQAGVKHIHGLGLC